MRLYPIKHGWAAAGQGWAVHAATRELAIGAYAEAVLRHDVIDERPFPWARPPEAGDYRAARGAIPHDPETPKAEVLIRRMRDAWEEDASAFHRPRERIPQCPHSVPVVMPPCRRSDRRMSDESLDCGQSLRGER